MKPRKLTICGWGPYKDRVEVDFDRFEGKGIFLITGPTGAGKTTIFDAISYALYGALSGEVRDKEKNSVRSDFADADTPTYVELSMVHGEKEYRVRRNPEYLRPKKRQGGENAFTKEKENAVLFLPDDKVIEGAKEVNAYIKDLLILDHAQFKQLSMIAQGEFARLLTAPPKDKTKIFREIFGTGIYERFTTALGLKAKKYYSLIMEQKNKLEEDIRLLVMGVQEADLPQESKERFQELIEAKYWNHDQILQCLEDMKKQTTESVQFCQRDYDGIEEKLEKETTYLTRVQEENKLVLQLRNALHIREELFAREEEYVRKELQYQSAVNAGWVESSDVKLEQEKRVLESLTKEADKLQVELQEYKEKYNTLLPFWEKREDIKGLIEVLAVWENSELQLKQMRCKLTERKQSLDKKKKEYEKKEKISVQKKALYDEAVLNQRRAAIGLAATMLVQGEPCPVCGSKEHPSPATLEIRVLSERELERCKLDLEEKERETAEAYHQVVVLQTQWKELEEQIEELEKEQGIVSVKLTEVKDGVCLEYLGLGAKKANAFWQKNSETMQRLQTLQKEKEQRLKQFLGEKDKQEQRIEESAFAFTQALLQYGFTREKDYRAAFLDKQQREGLKKELDDYRQKKIANKELIEHLRRSIKEDVIVDLEPVVQRIGEYKQEKTVVLQALKKWEQLVNELTKTRKVCKEKLAKIEEQSKEYGVIKELENIASGNNAKKLVFEQYVLAGYFEEILAAANVRFRKMTSGRYEMHRTKEVGDGRVKDNLEIEVMDFYTGKYRSIRTLSGGESFKASLSLALGLSDVIQAMSGGIKVDTLFIDEGFGALDSESLDQACATLMGLVETERMIGIISHVPELRERIGKQIVIERRGSGSTLKVVEGL